MESKSKIFRNMVKFIKLITLVCFSVILGDYSQLCFVIILYMNATFGYRYFLSYKITYKLREIIKNYKLLMVQKWPTQAKGFSKV